MHWERPSSQFNYEEKVLLGGKAFIPPFTIPSEIPVREAPKPGKRRASIEVIARPEKKTMTVCLAFKTLLSIYCMEQGTDNIQDSKMQLDNPQETVEMIKHGDIDESLYSRQL